MIKIRSYRLAILVCGLLIYQVTSAYTIKTHEKFSVYAVDRSVLASDPTLLPDLGLNRYALNVFNQSDDESANIQELMAFGSEHEDHGGDNYFQLLNFTVTKRFLRHFYDPQSEQGLRLAGRSYNLSPDWALERNQAQTAIDDSDQDYSFNRLLKFDGPKSRNLFRTINPRFLTHI